jgi:hypothetical protein
VDLQLYLRVLWRFRLLILAGLVVALGLSILSFVRFDLSGGSVKMTYRQPQQWRSEARLFVTQEGFPWGRTAPEYLTDPAGRTPPVPAADAARLSALAVLYAELAKGDQVRRLMGLPSPLMRLVTITTVAGPPFSSSAILPIIQITAVSNSPSGAVTLARRASGGLLTYIRREQRAARIEPSGRVDVQVLSRADSAILVSGRGKTLPLVVFLAVMIAVLGLAFILENLRPQVRSRGSADLHTAPPADATRRSA